MKHVIGFRLQNMPVAPLQFLIELPGRPSGMTGEGAKTGARTRAAEYLLQERGARTEVDSFECPEGSIWLTLGSQKHRYRLHLHRTAHEQKLGTARALLQLRQGIGKRQLRAAVDHQTHGSILSVPNEENDGLRKPGIPHLSLRHQELSLRGQHRERRQK